MPIVNKDYQGSSSSSSDDGKPDGFRPNELLANLERISKKTSMRVACTINHRVWTAALCDSENLVANTISSDFTRQIGLR